MSKTFIEELREREFEQYVVDQRNGYVSNDSFMNWRQRTKDVDDLIAGNYTVVWPNHLKSNEKPLVQNLAQVMSRDVPRLVSDIMPSLRSVAKKDGKEGDEAKYLREAIALTYWDENEGDLAVPLWTIDLIVTGAAFGVAWADEDEDCPYPLFERVDPRFCYPDIHNGKATDLMVIQRIKMRQAKRMFPEVPFSTKAYDVGEVEILDYYAKDMVVKAITEYEEGKEAKAGSTIIVSADKLELKRAPIAFAQLPSHDGAFRGLFDQSGDSMLARNRIARLMERYVDQQVAAPIVEKGLLNKNAKPGPNTMYSLDPQVEDAQMGRLQPAGSSPQLFALMQMLGEESRGAIGYPSARQGVTDISQGSASFMGASQGSLTSVVRECQKYIGKMREDLNATLFELDEKVLNFSKPLTVGTTSNKSTYTPKTAIEGVYKTKVVYGASAGLDRLQADARLLQLYTSGIITAKTSRENLEFVEDAEQEAEEWESEQTRKAILQKLVGDPNAPFDLVFDIFAGQEEGLSFGEAVVAARNAQRQTQAAAGGAPGAPQGQQLPAPPGVEPTAQVAEGGIERGAQPGEVPAGGEPEFSPAPLGQFIMRANS